MLLSSPLKNKGFRHSPPSSKYLILAFTLMTLLVIAMLPRKVGVLLAEGASQKPLQIWWPNPGSVVSGRQPFKVMLENLPVENYHMFWFVDGGQWNYMTTNYQDYPHKEAEVDLSGWNWRGNGPYKITFKAIDYGGSLVGEASTTIYINSPPPPSPVLSQPAPASVAVAAPSSALGEITGEIKKEKSVPSSALYAPLRPEVEKAITELRNLRPQAAKQLEKIASKPVALWFGGWNANLQKEIKAAATEAGKLGTLPVMVAYNIPQRDCGNYSAGGAEGYEKYKEWIKQFSAGLNNLRAMVILEPDALSLTDCLDEKGKAARMDLLKYAVGILKENPGVSVYLDAGHPGWIAPDETAKRLTQAGVGRADGFSLNVSNFVGTEENIRYGQNISEKLGGAHFVIDTGRSGSGTDGQWCNPQGRSLGKNPTLNTGEKNVDAFLWVKPPGESDGNCNGGPSAGTFWADYALGLAQRSNY